MTTLTDKQIKDFLEMKTSDYPIFVCDRCKKEKNTLPFIIPRRIRNILICYECFCEILDKADKQIGRE